MTPTLTVTNLLVGFSVDSDDFNNFCDYIFSCSKKYIESEIIYQYVSDELMRPWIVGFSGGKDSYLYDLVVVTAAKLLL